MISGSTIILCTIVSVVFWYLQSFLSNYNKAKGSGFPLYICPVDPQSILWIVFSVQLRSVFEKYLPAIIYERIKYAIYGWEFLSRYEPFQKFGPNFLLTTPGKNELYIADPELAHAVLTRRQDFVPQEVSKQIIGRFGPNLVTATDDDWVRQRKVVAPLLNERISELTWNETTRQARQMMETLIAAAPPTSISEVSRKTQDKQMEARTEVGGSSKSNIKAIQAIRNIAINVIGAVAYGAQQSWDQSISHIPKGFQLSYMESILSIVENLVPSTLVAPWLLGLPFLPKSLQRIGVATDEFPRHARELLDEERKSGSAERTHFMSTIIKLSDAQSRATDDRNSKTQLFLTEPELTGNMFLFTVAGFDTTANTMVYTILLLSLHPEWQDWIAEEIQQFAGTWDTGLEYSRTYPRLKRCLALMFEVLRLYTPVLHIARYTQTTQHITTKSTSYKIAPDTVIYVSAACLHANPNIYGSDALDFRPSRWIDSSAEPYSIISPQPYTFIPWSGGSRVCPGMKMAQVEFVAAMTTIFSKYKVSPKVRQGETLEMARTRLQKIVADSQAQVTLQVTRPNEVELQWEQK